MNVRGFFGTIAVFRPVVIDIDAQCPFVICEMMSTLPDLIRSRDSVRYHLHDT